MTRQTSPFTSIFSPTTARGISIAAASTAMRRFRFRRLSSHFYELNLHWCFLPLLIGSCCFAQSFVALVASITLRQEFHDHSTAHAKARIEQVSDNSAQIFVYLFHHTLCCQDTTHSIKYYSPSSVRFPMRLSTSNMRSTHSRHPPPFPHHPITLPFPSTLPQNIAIGFVVFAGLACVTSQCSTIHVPFKR